MYPLGKSLSLLADALEALGIPYLIGGSVASGARSIARATRDIDLVARIGTNQVRRLADALGPDWYADPQQMDEAIRRERAFNLIHKVGGHKIDIFPATQDFHEAQLARATHVRLPLLDEGRDYPVASAEDILLAKLRWYRDGGEVSDRQWEDISNILEMNPSIDLAYLRTWAARLRVDDLLTRALTPTTEHLP